MIWRVVGLVWAGALLLGLPFSSGALGRRLREEPVSRMAMYANALLSQLILIAPTLLIDLAGGGAGIRLIEWKLPGLSLFLWTLGTLAACVAGWGAMLIEARAHEGKSDQIVLHLLPRNGKERAAFFGVSIAAGFTEEYLWRGFCFAKIAQASGSLLFAFLLTSLAFGLAHLYQGVRGVWRATLIGAVLGIPVVFTGSLVPSMIAHTAIDMISGRWTLGILRSWGVVAE